MSTKSVTIKAAAFLALALSGCGGPEKAASSAQGEAANQGSAREAPDISVEGRIASGVECPIIRTPDGETYALSLGEADFGPSDYVRITGTVVEAGYCQQGQATLKPKDIVSITPPARDRDPARAGGLPVTNAYLEGGWVAKGLDADCDKPDFDVTLNSREMAIIETRVNGYPETGAIDVGPSPSIRFDEPLPSPAIETRGPDGLAIMPVAETGKLVIAGHVIEGDGVVFIKCG